MKNKDIGVPIPSKPRKVYPGFSGGYPRQWCGTGPDIDHQTEGDQELLTLLTTMKRDHENEKVRNHRR
jgi:hypothetical protein